MNYALMMERHPNVRYRESLKKLARIELEVSLGAIHTPAELVGWQKIGGLSLLVMKSEEPLKEGELDVLRQQSALMALFELKDDTLTPLMEGREYYFPEDMAAILKYKGKTNETFTDFMVHTALMASDFRNVFEPLTLIDPMCGRGTALFAALKRGHNVLGVDVDRKDIQELDHFVKRYLTFHGCKHQRLEENCTVPSRKGVRKITYRVADTAEHYKAKDVRTLSAVLGDARDLPYYGVKGAHGIVCDLPYGVQHGKESRMPLGKLLAQALPAWHRVLIAGGVMALAFNRYTLKREELEGLVRNAGFSVLEGLLSDCEHWVEQAVMRDVVFAKA